jgi:hypothetical protein
MEETITLTETPYDDTLEQIRQEFIAEQEAGRTPTLEAFVARYPKYAGELTNFILDYLRTENAAARVRKASRVQEEPASYAVSAVNRALTSLGINPDVEQ